MIKTVVPQYRDPLCRYYTRNEIGDLLVKSLGELVPTSILDLASGEGSLSRAALRRWRGIRLNTVDISHKLDMGSSGTHHQHFVEDVLDVELPSRFAAARVTSDLILCNPPFRIPEWRPGFVKILADAGLSDCVASPRDITAEMLFTAQSLRLVEPGGTLGLILPDGIITGARMTEFRRQLLAQHHVARVIQLPPKSFQATEAAAFIVVLVKGGAPRARVDLQQLLPNGELTTAISVDRSGLERRMDYAFHAVANRRTRNLYDMGATLVRGSFEPANAPLSVGEYFHTSSFANAEQGRVRVETAPNQHAGIVCAQPGDILIARVDRHLERKVCMLVKGHIALTSSVFRLRVEESIRERVFSTLLSDTGALLLRSISRGVGARMISKRDLMTLPLL